MNRTTKSLVVGSVATVLLALSNESHATREASSTPLSLNFETYQLANGLKVILHVDRSLPMVCSNLWFRAGSGNNPPNRSGLAHLCEHLLAQGTVHCNRHYIEVVGELGGETNGATWEDAVELWVSVPTEQLEAVLWLQSELMGFVAPALTEEILENERDVVLNEKRQMEQEPYAMSDSILKSLLYPRDHPYRRTTIGSAQDLNSITLDDVRNYLKLHFAPNGASLCIAGDFDPARTKEWIESYFGPLSPGPSCPRLQPWIPASVGVRRASVTDDVDLPRLYYAWHTPSHHGSSDIEMELLAHVIGQGKSSRLHRALILEQRMAHEVKVVRDPFALSSVFRIEVTARPKQDLDELELQLDQELERLLRAGVTEEELKQAKAMIEANRLRDLETLCGFGGRADLLNEYSVLVGDPARLATDLAAIDTLECSDLLRAARRHLDPDHRVVLTVEPRGDLRATEERIDRSQMPPATSTQRFRPPVIESTTLSNGLRICVVDRPNLPLVQVGLLVEGGWAADPPTLPGLARCTAQLLDEGTRSRTSLEIAEAFERLGAKWRTLSMFDRTLLLLNVSRRQLSGGLSLILEMLLGPTFPEEELVRYREQALDRLEEEEASVHVAPIKLLQKLVFGEGHPYAQPYTGSGTPQSLATITREDLVALHRSHYLPNNSTLILVGDIALEEARDLVASSWLTWKAGPPVTRTPVSIVPQRSPRIHLFDRPGAEQSYLLVGHRGIRRADSDFLAFTILNNILGGQHESRINMNLREDKGYTYGFRSLLLTLRDAGMFLGSCSVDTPHTDEALIEILDEIRELQSTHPIEDAELAAETTEMTKGFPDRFSSVEGIAIQLADLISYDQPLDSWQTFDTRVRAVDLAELQRVAHEHLNADSLEIIISGDLRRVEPEIEKLGLGRMERIDPDSSH